MSIQVIIFCFRIAMATKENMSRQRGALYQITNRMGGITSILHGWYKKYLCVHVHIELHHL